MPCCKCPGTCHSSQFNTVSSTQSCNTPSSPARASACLLAALMGIPNKLLQQQDRKLLDECAWLYNRGSERGIGVVSRGIGTFGGWV